MKKIARFALALLLAGMVGVASGGQKAKTSTVQGKVTAVTNNSLTIEHGSESMTFTIDESTKVVGKGLSTKMQQMAKAHEKFTITDGVAPDDRVNVTYSESDGKMHANQVHVVQKRMSVK